MKQEEIRNQILKPGTPFVVADNVKEHTFGPGTLGFISQYLNSGKTNLIVQLNAIIVRRGKGGKNRLNYNQLYTPIYLMDNVSFLEQLPLDMKYYVFIEKLIGSGNIAKLDPLAFLGWCSAYGIYLQNIAKYSKHGIKWPEDKSDPLHKAINMLNIWEHNPQRALERYTTIEMRGKIVNALRTKEAEMVKCGLSYKYFISNIREKALETMDNYGFNTEDTKKINKTAKLKMAKSLHLPKAKPKKKKYSIKEIEALGIINTNPMYRGQT